jgi:hypothetical protein
MIALLILMIFIVGMAMGDEYEGCTNYVVVEGKRASVYTHKEDMAKFTADVNKYLLLGYKPVGGVSVIYSYTYLWAQALCK